jgi:hypothetical protein
MESNPFESALALSKDSGSFNVHDSEAHRTFVLVGVPIAAFGHHPPGARAALGPARLSILARQQTLTAHMAGGKDLGIGNND